MEELVEADTLDQLQEMFMEVGRALKKSSWKPSPYDDIIQQLQMNIGRRQRREWLADEEMVRMTELRTRIPFWPPKPLPRTLEGSEHQETLGDKVVEAFNHKMPKNILNKEMEWREIMMAEIGVFPGQKLRDKLPGGSTSSASTTTQGTPEQSSASSAQASATSTTGGVSSGHSSEGSTDWTDSSDIGSGSQSKEA